MDSIYERMGIQSVRAVLERTQSGRPLPTLEVAFAPVRDRAFRQKLMGGLAAELEEQVPDCEGWAVSSNIFRGTGYIVIDLKVSDDRLWLEVGRAMSVLALLAEKG